MKSTYSKKAQNGSVTVKAVEIIAAIIVIAGGVYLISTHSSKSAPTTDSNGNPIPVLNSVNPSSASIGTLVTVNGSGLAGFEGDKNLWITDGSGNTAIIHGDANSSATQISFTLADQYCTADTSYSGMDCPSYENIVPGTYTLTAKPWGTESNSLQLTVVGSQTVSTSTNSAFNWSIYSDSSHGFSFKYPSNFTLTSSTTETGYYDYQITTLANVSGTEQYIDRNTFWVSADNNPVNVSRCVNNYDGTGRNATDIRNINGTSFYIIYNQEPDDAMGGARGQVSEYRTVHNGYCYIINSEVYWHIVGYEGVINNGVNSAPMATQQAQGAAITNEEAIGMQMINSFTFTN